MQLQSYDISAEFNKIVLDACSRCEPVQITDGERIIAVLQPLGPSEASRTASIETNEVYRTWGETLSE